MRILYDSFSKTGGDKLVWKLDSSRLRILCYHGLCEDRLAKEPWVPLHFVTISAFEKQMQYLQRNAHVLPLREAVTRLAEGSLPPRSVCLTFDDGHANNLELAYPPLRKYDMHATIFLSSAYIESGDFFPFLKVKLIRLDGGVDLSKVRLADYDTAPLDEVDRSAGPWWPEVSKRLSDDQRRTLRPLTVAEVKGADAKRIDFGPHSHTHCILKNETPERRRDEIRTSIRKVKEWTSRPLTFFSYPNGQRGDFNEADKQVLRAEGIHAAVTGIGGANNSRTEPLELKRYPIGLFHDDAGFRAEVTGLRSALRAASGRRV